MPSNLRPVTVQNFVVTLNGANGLPGSVTFSKASSPRISRSEVAYNDGQTGQAMATYGFASREKLTLSKAYDPVADEALEVWAQKAIEQPTATGDFTVTVQPVQSDVAGTPIAQSKSRVYSGCQMVSLRVPDVDRSGSGLAMLELEVYFQNSTKQ